MGLASTVPSLAVQRGAFVPCLEVPPGTEPREHYDLWFPERRALAESDQYAAALCWGCPIRTECLSVALSVRAHGIWGGLSEPTRDRMMRRERRAS